MPHFYWVEAASIDVHIMNRTPTIVVHDVTLEEKFFGRKYDLTHLNFFGVYFLCACAR